jgi:transposase
VTQHRLSKTEAALDIMGKAHALLAEISENALEPRSPKRR